MPKQIPAFKTEEELETFIDGDLSDLDFSKLRPVHFEFAKKTAQVNMRLPEALLDAVKKRSELRGIPYTRFIREAIEQAITREAPKIRQE
jgi:predicted DNA binding CopG/RHH family protein